MCGRGGERRRVALLSYNRDEGGGVKKAKLL